VPNVMRVCGTGLMAALVWAGCGSAEEAPRGQTETSPRRGQRPPHRSRRPWVRSASRSMVGMDQPAGLSAPDTQERVLDRHVARARRRHQQPDVHRVVIDELDGQPSPNRCTTE
jgi:hypothetical protein